jgi:hypothetical protein
METTDMQADVKRAVDDAIARIVAIGALVAIALVHILQLPTAFDAIGYLGALFIAAVVAAGVLAAVLARTSDDRAWALAGGLAGLILLGYVLSRSVGLPGFTDDMGDWADAPGLASMLLESLEVVVACAVLAGRRHPRRSAARAPGMRGMRPGPAAG